MEEEQQYRYKIATLDGQLDRSNETVGYLKQKLTNAYSEIARMRVEIDDLNVSMQRLELKKDMMIAALSGVPLEPSQTR